MSPFSPKKTLNQLQEGSNPTIEQRLTQRGMSRLLQKDWKNGQIRGAHWFRDAFKWYRMNFAFNNPYNLGSIHSELLLIQKYAGQLRKYVKNRQQVFFGIGTGDTEMALVNISLNHSQYAEVIAVDANSKFIVDFAHSIKAKLREDIRYEVRFLGIHTLFENLSNTDFERNGSRFKRKVLVCLGNTIGNYTDVSEILRLFRHTSKIGDQIIIGFQTNKHIKSAYAKYKTNKLMQLMLNDCIRPDRRKSLKWRLDEKNFCISAHVNGIEVFRSMKYDPEYILKAASKFGFIELESWLDSYENVELLILEYKYAKGYDYDKE